MTPVVSVPAGRAVLVLHVFFARLCGVFPDGTQDRGQPGGWKRVATPA
jgi:hypothetical protein